MTPNSSGSPYASTADLLIYYDIRTVADLLSDAGARLGGTIPDPSVVQGSPTLLAMLAKGAGYLEAACLRAKRYGPADLQKLVTDRNDPTKGSVSGEFLVGLNCDLAMGFLYLRRPDKGKPGAAFEMALQWLEALANGEMVFAFEEAEAAGLPSENVDTAGVIERRGLTETQAGRFFGTRADQLNDQNIVNPSG